MYNTNRESEVARLRTLLRQSRPASELPPRFQESVWRSVERDQAGHVLLAGDWMAGLAARLLNPRWALAGIAALLLLGAFLGTLDQLHEIRQTAQDRYLAAVAPAVFR